jgi:two-component system, LytTR family, sensor kinase
MWQYTLSRHSQALRENLKYMAVSFEDLWLNNRYVRISKYLIFSCLYWFYIMSDFNMTIASTGDKIWNSIFTNSIFAVILTSLFSLTYALKKCLSSRFYLFVVVAIAVYLFNAYFIYFSIRFLAGMPDASKFVLLANQRMSDISLLKVPFDRFVDLYIWAMTGNYIVVPLAIIGIGNTFFYFNRNLQLQKDNLALELDFLRSQLNPHFLFNSLNNIYSMVEETNREAGDTILKLADLMRYLLYESNSEQVYLSREVSFLEDYIALEKIRHSNASKITFESAGSFEYYRIPPFLLVPFVENAFKHGLDTIEDGWVTIKILLDGSQLNFEVTNSKPQRKRPGTQKGGIGLVNLKKRLDIYYPGQHELKIDDSDSVYKIYLRLSLK